METKVKVHVRELLHHQNGEIPLLVATDIASRGIDIEGVTHVFNYDLPNEPESYVHRIGRTARAGKSGVAYAFCDESESGYLVGIQRLIGKQIPQFTDHPYHFPKAIPKPNQKPGKIKEPKNKNKNKTSQSEQNSGQRNNNRNKRTRNRRNRRHKKSDWICRIMING